MTHPRDIIGRYKVPLLVVLCIVLVLAPMDLTAYGLPWGGLRRYGIYILNLWLVYAIAAMGVNLIIGYSGQETLAQAAFLGIGAYITALLMGAGVPWFACFFLSAIAAFIVGVALGFPALRVQGHYLAFITLAFAMLIYLFLRNEEWLTGGVSGIQNIDRPTILGVRLRPAANFYWFTLGITAALTFVMWWLLQSPWGRAFMALRENAIRAESLGIDVRGYKLLTFAIGSAYGGMAGALYAPLVEFIDPAPFALAKSFEFLLMVVVGGAGFFAGPFVGAAVSVLLPEWLRFAQDYYLFIYALLVMILVAFCPTGLVGLYQRLVTPARRPHADVKGPSLGEVKP